MRGEVERAGDPPRTLEGRARFQTLPAADDAVVEAMRVLARLYDDAGLASALEE